MLKESKRNIKLLQRLIMLIAAAIYMLPADAQVFPVQATISIIPPHSVYLSQYTSPGQDKIRVSVLLRDPVIPSLDVRFRFVIQGGGLTLETDPSWMPQPFPLPGSVITSLPAELIAEYLNPRHLIVTGNGSEEFLRTTRLPEGVYEFRIEVIEYRRTVTVSNAGKAVAWLMLNEPPHFVYPASFQKVDANNPQMINFVWTAGGVTSPGSALNTRYEFVLAELTNNADPTIAISTASEAVKFTKVVDHTSLLYGPADMQLLPGKSYVVRVRAFNPDEPEMFKNGGFSEAVVFKFGDACSMPVSFNLADATTSTFGINVMSNPINTGWQCRFREAGKTIDWTETEPALPGEPRTIKGLKPGTAYEVQVRAVCGLIQTEYLPVKTISTVKEPVITKRDCSVGADRFIVTNATPLASLNKDEIFFAGLFPILVKEVTSSAGGKFSGQGVATLPLFNTGLAVTFDNISINELRQLTEGEVKAVKEDDQ